MYHYVSAAVGGRFDQVFRRYDCKVRDFRQFLYREVLVAVRRVQASTDGGSAKVNFQQQFGGAQQVFSFFIQQDVECMEFLTQGHRNRVLQLGTTHFQDGFEFYGLTLEAFAQLVNGIHQFNDRSVHRDAETGRVCIVGGLAFINVVVWIQILVFTFLMSHQFKANVCQHFVRVHINGGACATLVNIHRELVHAFAVVQHFVTGGDNRVRDIFRNGLQLFVCHRCGFLHHYHSTHELRNVADFAVADVKVFNRSQSVYAVVGLRWNFPGTQQIFFDTNVV